MTVIAQDTVVKFHYTLTFDVEVVDVRAATDEEIAHGHAHGEGGHHH